MSDEMPGGANALIQHITTAVRRQRIAELAYYRALHRGFSPGGELADWLAAENDVDISMGRAGFCGQADTLG